MALLIGVFVGLATQASESDKSFKEMLNFKEEFFFLVRARARNTQPRHTCTSSDTISLREKVLLPPIIFESGFSMRPRPFFHNFGAICTLAFVGTFVSALSIALVMWVAGAVGMTYSFSFVECMIYGSLISATDPVTVLAIFQSMNVQPDLYALVFGESVLNDAVAIVLYRTMLTIRSSEFTMGVLLNAVAYFGVIFAGSFVIGVACGLASALLLKHSHMHEMEASEACVVVIFPFLAYSLSQYLALSGIVSILFCGIVMAHYAKPNLSVRGQEALPYFFRTLASLAETFVFVYMGATVFLQRQEWSHVALTLVILLAVLGARALQVYPLTAAVNKIRLPSRRIPRSHKFMLWFAGLRGAIAFALSLESVRDIDEETGRIFLTTTLFVVMFTVLGVGGATGHMVDKLKLRAPPEDDVDNDDVEMLDDLDDGDDAGNGALNGVAAPSEGGADLSVSGSEGGESPRRLRRGAPSRSQNFSFKRLDEFVLTPMFTHKQGAELEMSGLSPRATRERAKTAPGGSGDGGVNHSTDGGGSVAVAPAAPREAAAMNEVPL